MPRIKSAKKRVDVAERNRLRNTAYKSGMRTAMKKFLVSLQNSEATTLDRQQAMGKAFGLMDRAVLKGIMHKNTIARYKSRMAKKLNATLTV